MVGSRSSEKRLSWRRLSAASASLTSSCTFARHTSNTFLSPRSFQVRVPSRGSLRGHTVLCTRANAQEDLREPADNNGLVTHFVGKRKKKKIKHRKLESNLDGVTSETRCDLKCKQVETERRREATRETANKHGPHLCSICQTCFILIRILGRYPPPKPPPRPANTPPTLQHRWRVFLYLLSLQFSLQNILCVLLLTRNFFFFSMGQNQNIAKKLCCCLCCGGVGGGTMLFQALSLGYSTAVQ